MIYSLLWASWTSLLVLPKVCTGVLGTGAADNQGPLGCFFAFAHIYGSDGNFIEEAF